MLEQWGMSDPLPCLRRTEPSAALIPHAGQRTLTYVPAQQSDIRKRIQELNRSIAARHELAAESSPARLVIASEAESARSPVGACACASQPDAPAEDRWRMSEIARTGRVVGGVGPQGGAKESLKPAIRLKDLARVAVAYARRRLHATAVQSSPEVVRVETQPRRVLPLEERAEIDALRRFIGPALRAALRRSASKDDEGEAAPAR